MKIVQPLIEKVRKVQRNKQAQEAIKPFYTTPSSSPFIISSLTLGFIVFYGGFKILNEITYHL
jgi:hypothetical protein